MRFIDPNKSYAYFERNFTLKKTSQGWWTFDCPFCGKRNKMAVNFNYGFAKCWVCEWRGNVFDFVKQYEGISYKQARDKVYSLKPAIINFQEFDAISKSVADDVSEIELPVGYNSLLQGSGALADRARNYLSGRGFDLEYLDRIGIGYVYHNEDLPEDEDFFGYIIIPFISNGKLVYYIGRDFIGNFLRYKNPAKEKFGVGKGDVIFNEDALRLYPKVYVLEGWADAVTIGDNAVSTQGWSLSQRQVRVLMMSDVDELVFVPDAGVDGVGESFYHKAIKSAMSFLNTDKLIKVLNLNKISDAGKDVNELGADIVFQLEQDTGYLDFETATMELLL